MLSSLESPKGSILGPLLYNLYSLDIPPLLGGGTLSLFADDSAISYKGLVIRNLVSKIQTGLNVHIDYLTYWKICVNLGTMQTILFPLPENQPTEAAEESEGVEHRNRRDTRSAVPQPHPR